MTSGDHDHHVVEALFELCESQVERGGVHDEKEVSAVEADDCADFYFVVGVNQDEVLWVDRREASLFSY